MQERMAKFMGNDNFKQRAARWYIFVDADPSFPLYQCIISCNIAKRHGCDSYPGEFCDCDGIPAADHAYIVPN